MGTRHPTGRRSLVRVLAGFVLVLLLAAGISVGLVPVPAGADPTPAPAPTAPQPTPTPTPTPNPPSTPNPTPDPTPNPSPQPQPTAPADTSSDDNPAWYDIPGQVRKAIKDFFAELVGDNISLVMGWLGTTVLSTPDLTADERVQHLVDHQSGHHQRRVRAVHRLGGIRGRQQGDAADPPRAQADPAPSGGGWRWPPI